MYKTTENMDKIHTYLYLTTNRLFNGSILIWLGTTKSSPDILNFNIAK